jgi:UDP-glucose 4-epimerase
MTPVPARALVLGAGGFLGSHLCRGLLARGWEVSGIVRDPDCPHAARRLAGLEDRLRLVPGDVADTGLLERETTDVDAVFPFAGRSGAARSVEDPFPDLTGNATPQLALLETLRRTGRTPRVVFPGSRLQYGRARHLPVDEEHPREPTSVYGVHKLLGEHYHRLYHDLHGLPTTCLRISNPYGPHQDRADAAFGVVGTFLATAAAGGDLQLFGGGHQLRDYVYVEDLVDLCVRAAVDPQAVGRVYNAGGRHPTSLREMAEAVVATVGRGGIRDVPWPPTEARVETGDYVTDISRAREELGWQPRISLDEGLALTWTALQPLLTPTPPQERP